MAAKADLGRQRTLDWGVRPALGREDFLVAPCNEAAVAWLDRWPDWPAPALVIHGPPGSGKSHLAEVWRRRSGAEIVPAMPLSEVPLDVGDTPALVIDGLDGPIDERALLHTYNGVAERDGHLLLTALAPPARWPLALPDLASRLRLAPAVALGLPDDALLAALMLKLFADRQITVAPEVPAYVVPRIERTFEAVARLVERLDRAALAEGRAVTVPLVRRVLALDEGESEAGPHG
ncbi:MAG: DNA replication protein [Rhodospirillales bacterium]|nr:DNA replication protein [Rhodospirillales bacterium]